MQTKGKKLVSMLLVLSVLLLTMTACGGNSNSGNGNSPGSDSSTPASNGGGNTANTPSNAPKKAAGVIDVAALITKEDATAILEQDAEVDDYEAYVPISFSTDKNYSSADYTLSINLIQEAGWDKKNERDSDYVTDGWANYIKSFIENLDRDVSLSGVTQTIAGMEIIINIEKVDGIEGASAYLQEGAALGQWLLHVIYGEYKMVLVIGNASFSRTDSEEDIAWKQAKIKNAGNLAVDRLKAIIG